MFNFTKMTDKKILQNNLPLFLSILLLFVTTMCDTENETYIKKTDIVPITEFSIPDSSISLADTIEIQATAKVNNGCWKDLYFIFSELNDTTYDLRAYGTYESYGTCPAVEVTKDTSFHFTPVQKGYNIFFVTRNPYQYTVDTLIVED